MREIFLASSGPWETDADGTMIDEGPGFIDFPGERVLARVPSPGYPFALDDDEMQEVFQRIRRYRGVISYEVQGVYPLTGLDNVITGGAEGMIELVADGGGDPPTHYYTSDGAQGGWRGTMSGSEIRTENGEEVSTGDPIFAVRLKHGSNSGEEGGAAFYPSLYYMTGTRQWMPSLFLHIDGSGAGFRGNSLGVVAAGAGEKVVTVQASFRGKPFDYSLVMADYLDVVSFSLELLTTSDDPGQEFFWPFRNAAGEQAIWNPVTGVRLLDPLTAAP